jgi:glycosyltransferase involved in cell wall biosynthesis
MTFLFFFIALILLTASVIAAYNYFSDTLFVFRQDPLSDPPLISVLIPARNEEGNIGPCIHAVLSQTYRRIEVLVLNDHSEDGTAAVAESITLLDDRVRLIRGKELPGGWGGKNWACHQLSEEARGDILLFIDADVRLAPEAVSSAVRYLQGSDLAMLSVFPTQKIRSFGEWLIVPLMNWLLLSFLPLRKVFTSDNRSFVAANGQFICFGKEAYRNFGGHAAVKDTVVEDMEIARLLKRSGQRIMTLLGGNLVSCRMYNGFRDAIGGFSKNFYPGFNMSAPAFICMTTLLFFAFTAPYVLLCLHGYFLYLIILISSGRFFIALASRQNPLLNIVLHPIQMLFMYVIGLRSVFASRKGKLIWKGRRI